MSSNNKTTSALRVWHIPQVPGEMFFVPVTSVEQARFTLDMLASYDLFQFHNKIKPDYASVSGLEVLEDDEWVEWNDDWGSDIHEVYGLRG